MTTYYCIHGLGTGANNGTSATDAWQDLTAVFSNTVTPALVAGDVVYVATKYSGADISISSATALSAATVTGMEADPITIIFDDGTNIGESGGTLTKIATLDTAALNLKTGWRVLGGGRLKLVTSSSASNLGLIGGHGYFEGIELHYTNASQQCVIRPYNGDYKSNMTLENCVIYPYGSTASNSAIFEAYKGSVIRLINTWVDFKNHSAAINNSAYWVFSLKSLNFGTGKIFAHGGGVRNASTVFNCVEPFYNYTTAIGGDIALEKFSLPSIMNTVAAGFLKCPEPITDSFSGATTFAMQGGVDPYDMAFATTNGWAQVEESGLYPTLSAKFPDSPGGTAYSMKIYPKTVTLTNPFIAPRIIKDYDQTAASKTITVEVLSDSRQSPTDYEIWIDVIYTNNSDGSIVVESSRSNKLTESALSSSTASWTSTTYSTQSYTKRKLTVTTANSIAQYTTITVILHVALQPYDTNSFWFYDPDFSII